MIPYVEKRILEKKRNQNVADTLEAARTILLNKITGGTLFDGERCENIRRTTNVENVKDWILDREIDQSNR